MVLIRPSNIWANRPRLCYFWTLIWNWICSSKPCDLWWFHHETAERWSWNDKKCWSWEPNWDREGWACSIKFTNVYRISLNMFALYYFTVVNSCSSIDVLFVSFISFVWMWRENAFLTFFFKIQKTRLFTFFKCHIKKRKSVERVVQVFTFVHFEIANGHFHCKIITHMSFYRPTLCLKKRPNFETV